ncbi:MAG: phosphoadenylyl-sulfate reductase [Ideonella sp.]
MNAYDLYARKTPGFEQRLQVSLDLLRQAAADFPGAIVQSTSLGAEDMVITDLIARHGLEIDLATLDTGLLHIQTLELIKRLEDRYGLPVQIFEPLREATIQFVRQHGARAMYDSIELRKACCAMRKLEPLARLLAGRSAWVTGLRREQSASRVEIATSEDDGNGRRKISPLAAWSWNDVWHYIASNDVPYNPLHDRFMPSIGCAPCTREIAVGEDFRAGRWWWEDERAKECGLHVKPAAATSSSIGAHR